MGTQPLFHLRHSPFFLTGMVTSVNLNEYEILGFDRQVADLSTTDGVFNLLQRDGLLQCMLQKFF